MLNENLKAARKAKGITQEELATRLSVVRQTVSKWENGLSVPDADILVKISEILEVPTDKLLGSEFDFEENVSPTTAEQLSEINGQLAGKMSRTRRFSKVLLAVILSLFAYLIGSAIEISPSVNLPGFGIAALVLTMGGIISNHILKKW